MRILTYIRKKKWLINSLLAICLVAFFLSNTGSLIEIYFRKEPITNVGTIAGHKISKHTYQEQFNKEKLWLKKHKPNEYIHSYVWSKFFKKYAYKKTYEKLGLQVSKEEIINIMQGNYIVEDIRKAFTDQKTGKFDKNKWINYIKELSETPQGRRFLNQLEDDFASERLAKKLAYLLQESRQITELEHFCQLPPEPINIRYLYIPYTSIANNSIQVSTKEEQGYLDKHQQKYQQKESRSIQYVNFPIVPSKENVKLFKKKLNALAKEFSAIEQLKINIFVKHHTDNQEEVLVTWTKENIPAIIKSQLENSGKDTVIGPIQDGNNYTLYRLVNTPNKPLSKEEYQFAKIEKNIMVSQDTIDEVYRSATDFGIDIKNKKQWTEKAKKEGLETHKETISIEEVQLIRDTPMRELYQWLYNNDTKVNNISPAIRVKYTTKDVIKDNITVAIMTEKKEAGKGTLTDVKVKNSVHTQVANQHKAKLITEKLEKLLSEKDFSLHQLKKHYTDNAQVYEKENLQFEDNELPYVGLAYKAIGSAFGLQVGKKTGIIRTEEGIIIIERTEDKDIPEDISMNEYRKELVKKEKDIQLKAIDEFLKQQANIKDQRYLFY